ncbi:MAG: YjgP/YjgQ family permease [Deltaproteobacteria bacterium]|nr:MAG: YjgP/YjgQ family permease [Deltaproteobacteria bacterium]
MRRTASARILHLYLLREILTPFGVGLGLFFAVVAFAQMLRVADSLTGVGLSARDFFAALLFSLPPLLGLLLPVSSLFATLLGVGRLPAGRESVAVYAAGISPTRFFIVPLCLGATLACLSTAAMTLGEPWGISGLRDLMARGAQRALAGGVRVGTFNEWVPGLTLYAAGRDANGLRAVIFADRRDPEQPLLISAAHGQLRQGARPQDLIFSMQDGHMLLIDADTRADRLITFAEGSYRIDVSTLVGNKSRHFTGAQEMGLRELWQASRAPHQDSNRRGLLLVTLHRKFAVPLASVVFSLLAVPLGLRPSSAARARGLLWSTAIVASYYYLGRAAELAARSGQFPPVLAAWLPNLCGALALILLYRGMRRGIA